MFQWYQCSTRCVAHLFDLKRGSPVLKEEDEDIDNGQTKARVVEDMSECEWFTRGWMLLVWRNTDDSVVNDLG
jgi:hypothetical protein